MTTHDDAENMYFPLLTAPIQDDHSISWETLQYAGSSLGSPPSSRREPADLERLEAPDISEQELSHAALALLAATHGHAQDARPQNDEIMSCSSTESEGTVRLVESDASMTVASVYESDDGDDRSSVTEVPEVDTTSRRLDCGDDPLAAKEALRQEVATFIRESDFPSPGVSVGDDISCLVAESPDPSVLEEWLVKAGLPSSLSDSISSRLRELRTLGLPDADLRRRVRAVLIEASRAVEVDQIRTDLIEPPKLEPVGFSGAERFVKRKWCGLVQG